MHERTPVLSEPLLSAFENELEKIAGGWTRSGKTPFRMDTLASKVGRFAKKSVTKTAAAPKVPRGGGAGAKALFTAAAAGGAATLYGAHKGKEALNDYSTGRAIRKQREGSY